MRKKIIYALNIYVATAEIFISKLKLKLHINKFVNTNISVQFRKLNDVIIRYIFKRKEC